MMMKVFRGHLYDKISYFMYFIILFFVSGGQRLITINHIQNKRFCVHNICVYTVYIYYAYINTHTCMYVFKKNMLCLYIKYIYI